MIDIKTTEEIEILAEGGKILGEILGQLCEMCQPGVSTFELEQEAEKLIAQAGGISSFKNYNGYPFILCTSLNEEVVHAFPSKKTILKNGDILGIDIGMKYKGFYTDMAYTVSVGKLNSDTKKLVEVTKQALQIGIDQIKPGNHIGDIGSAIQKFVNEHKLGYGIVREFAGHGVGRKVHEDPMIPNYGKAGEGAKLKPGMVLAIEPMVTMGDWRVMVMDNGWTVVTADNSLAAHFEKTVVVTEDGCRELTPFVYDK
ncbi:MAG: type I methionyl aminopeptidase [Patescibacteria group bacterium]